MCISEPLLRGLSVAKKELPSYEKLTIGKLAEVLTIHEDQRFMPGEFVWIGRSNHSKYLPIKNTPAVIISGRTTKEPEIFVGYTCLIKGPFGWQKDNYPCGMLSRMDDKKEINKYLLELERQFNHG